MNEEHIKNQEKTYNDEEMYEDFILATGSAKIYRKKYIEARTRLSKSIRNMQLNKSFKNDMYRYAEKLRESSEFKQALNVSNQYYTLRLKWEEEILKVFQTVFEDVRSKNHALCKLPNHDWEVTCGKSGFGRRDNVQATPVGEYEMRLILDHADVVAKYMKKQNMKKEAEKLLRFAQKAPEKKSRFATEPMFVDLNQSILIPTDDNYGEGICDVLRYSKIRIDTGNRIEVACVENEPSLDTGSLLYVDEKKNRKEENADEEKIQLKTNSISLSEYGFDDDDDYHAIAMYQLKDQFNVVNAIQMQAEKELQKLQSELNALKKEFGKELLVDIL